jgi:hypothetical protein
VVRGMSTRLLAERMTRESISSPPRHRHLRRVCVGRRGSPEDASRETTADVMGFGHNEFSRNEGSRKFGGSLPRARWRFSCNELSGKPGAVQGNQRLECWASPGAR